MLLTSILAALGRKALLFLILLSFGLSSNTLMGQDLFATVPPPEKACAPLIGNVAARNVQSLNGTWNALIDPTIFSLNDFFHYAERNYKPIPSELVEVDIENGLTLRVPGDWNTQDDRLFFYNGKVWYKRDFVVDKADDQRYYLHFGAINYRAEIHVNGTLVATHTGGYTSFNCEVTEAIADGNNFVVVKVDNTLTAHDIPTTRTDWLNYGGITRDVNLISVPRSYIRNYKIQLDPQDPNQIQAWIDFEGEPQESSVRLQITELGIDQKVKIKAGKTTFSLKASPQLWSPDDPKLYDIRLSHAGEIIEDRIGFRTVKIENGQILLNGEALFLRGISIHEEAIGAHGRSSSPAEARELLAAAQRLNCNFVRLAHYTHNEHMLRAADEMGLLVWAEIPVYWNLMFEEAKVLEMGKERMESMIMRDQNRASIIFWSLGNETPISDARNAFFKALNNHVKRLDNTRLTTAAMVFGGEEIQAMAKAYYFPTMQGQSFETWDIEIEDPLAEIVDVAAINQYFGWYYSGFLAQAAGLPANKARKVMLANMNKVRFHLPDNKPFVFSEMGAGAKRGKSHPEEELVVFSEEYQALVYRKQIELVKNQKGLVGMSPWILKDFRSPMRQRQGVQDYWNLKGLISDNGEPKQAFFVLRDFYQSY